MNPFFEYLLKSTISLALFYIVFKLAVSRDKMHTVNRFVLLGILITSAILPLAEIPVLQENQGFPQVEVFRQIMETPVFNNPQPAVSEEIQTVQPDNPLEINPFLLAYLSAIILLFLRLTISLVSVWQIIRKAEKQSFQNYMLAVVKDFIHPFSFLKNIVISEKDYAENREMVITHEYAHIKHFHAIDLVICELFTALHWFNPFMWLLRRDLKLIHEYQADQAVLNKGIDAAKYQLLVLEKAVGERRFAMANHFTQKPILKRIKMMKKTNLNRWTGIKLILFVPLVVVLLQAFSQPDKQVEKNNDFVPEVIQQDQSTEAKQAINIKIDKNGDLFIGEYLYPKTGNVKQLLAWGKKTSIEELPEYLKTQKSFNKKQNEKDLIVNIEDELGISVQKMVELKEILREAKIEYVNYNKTSQTNLKESLNENFIKIGTETYRCESSILGNESYEDIGKLELDFFSSQYDKKIALYFLSIKSDSLETPSLGTYIYESKSYNQRKNYTFWGKVSVEGKESDIQNGKLEILNNSIRNFKATFEIVLKDGTRISGQYDGVVAYNDWRKSKNKSS